MSARITKTLRFEAAHFVPTFPQGHKCRRIHGHSFRADLVVVGEVNPKTGIVVDFAEIKRIAAPTIDALDHRLLNEVEGLEIPTAEYLAEWIYKKIKPDLPGLERVRVFETESNVAEYPA